MLHTEISKTHTSNAQHVTFTCWSWPKENQFPQERGCAVLFKSRTSTSNCKFKTCLRFSCVIPHSNKFLLHKSWKLFPEFAGISGLHSQNYTLNWVVVKNNHASSFYLSLKQWSKPKNKWGVWSLNISVVLNLAQFVHILAEREYSSTAQCSVLLRLMFKYRHW